MVFVFDRYGHAVYGEYYPYGEEEKRPLPGDLIGQLMNEAEYGAFLKALEARSYILRFEDAILIAALHPVTDSNAEAAANGAILFARYIDSALLESFGDAMSVPVTLEQTAGTGGVVSGSTCGEHSCMNRVALRNAKDATVGILLFETQRDIYEQGRETLFVLISLFLLVAVVSLVILWFFLEKSILSRLTRLSSEMTDLRIDDMSPMTVSVSGKDELSDLGKTINRMLSKIYEYQQEQRFLANRTRLLAMGKMVRDIAHHWRQPLTAVAANVQNIQFEYEDNALDHKMLNRFVCSAMEQISGMSRVIDDFSRFYDTEVREELFDTAEQVERALKVVTPRMKENGIKVVCDIPEYSARLYGSAADMVHVLSGLLDNAVDAIVRSPGSDTGRIDIAWWQDDSTVHVRVCDNGEGMAEAVREKLFDPYFSTKHDQNGTGLGLYMAKMVVEYNMHGVLVLDESRAGKTCFYLKLPRVTAQE
jgi:signal transduction histidine kinase